MSIFSDYRVGALTEEEFRAECIAYDNKERADEQREYEREMMELSDDDIFWVDIDD